MALLRIWCGVRIDGSNYERRAGPASMSRRSDRGIVGTIWLCQLLALLLTTLCLVGIPVDRSSTAEEPGFAARTDPQVCFVAPHDGAVLPAVYLLDVYLPTQPAWIEASTAPYPSLRLPRSASRAPPIE